jgi:membrane protein YqaA with SNARE-associated domain
VTGLFAALGLAGLGASAFLAGSLVPLPSEAVLAALLAAGGDPLACVAVASVANTLGAATLLWAGRGGRQVAEKRLTPGALDRLASAQAHVARFGALALLLAWLPVVGDVLVLAAGMLRVRWLPALVALALGKSARYAFVAWAMA